MHMRVTRARSDPKRFDESVRVMLQAAEAVRQLPGNDSTWVVGDRATGEAVVISTWDTEDHARWSPDALGEWGGKLQAVGVQFDPPQIFEGLG